MTDEQQVQAVIRSLLNNWEHMHVNLTHNDNIKKFDDVAHCHNGFPLDLDDLKNKWSRHRFFLYGCDRSPGIHVFKLGIKIPNLKQDNWSTKMI